MTNESAIVKELQQTTDSSLQNMKIGHESDEKQKRTANAKNKHGFHPLC